MRNLQVRFPEKYVSEPVNLDLDDKVIKNIFPLSSTIQILSERDYVNKPGAHSARTFSDTQFIMEASFSAASELLVKDLSKWLKLKVTEKILQFTSLLSHMRKDIKLGGVICLHQILKAAAPEITEEAKTIIIEEIFLSLADYANQEQIFIAACLEVIGLLGPCRQSISKIELIKSIMCDP